MTWGLVLAAICLAITAAFLFWLLRPADDAAPDEVPARQDADVGSRSAPSVENPFNSLVDGLGIPVLSEVVRAQELTGREQLPDAEQIGWALGEPVEQVGGDMGEFVRSMPARMLQYKGTRTGTVVDLQVSRGALASAASAKWERKGTRLAVPGVSAFRHGNRVLVCRLDGTVVHVMVRKHPGDVTQALTALASAVAREL
jgi:hypothetical protein